MPIAIRFMTGIPKRFPSVRPCASDAALLVFPANTPTAARRKKVVHAVTCWYQQDLIHTYCTVLWQPPPNQDFFSFVFAATKEGADCLPREALVDPDPRFVKSGWAISGKMASASTARSGRKDTWREQQQKQFFWEHEKAQPTKTFILPCRAADPRGDFPLDDLQSGRTDLMCRAISSAMFFSSGVRRDVNVVLILGSASGSLGSASGTSAAGDAGGESGQRAGPVKTRAVWINGRNVRHLRPDERNVAFVLQTAVWAYTGRVAALSRRVESSRRPGKVGMHTEDGCGEQEDNGIGVSAAAMTESVRGWRRKESLVKREKARRAMSQCTALYFDPCRAY